MVAPLLTKELNISQIEYGCILQAFLLAYAIMYVGSGVLRMASAQGTRVHQRAGQCGVGVGRHYRDAPGCLDQDALRVAHGVRRHGSDRVCLAGLWLALYELPHNHRFITSEELMLIQSGPTLDGPPKATWAELWKQREVWGLLLARFLSDPVWWLYLFWMPKYLVEQRGFTMVEIGVIA